MENWTTGLFGCFEDIPSTFITCLFPWITIAHNKAALQGRKEPTAVDLCCAFSSNPVVEVYNTRKGGLNFINNLNHVSKFFDLSIRNQISV